jgi:hypothetical protein
MSKRVAALDLSLSGKRLLHDGTTYTVRGAWVKSRQPKGEKYLLLYNPDTRHALDASDAVELC